MTKPKQGRKPGFVMDDSHRTKIQNSAILACLIQHAEGNRAMTATQVAAGLGLLRKVLPDLALVTVTGPDNGPIQTQDVTAADILRARIDAIASRAAGASASE